MKIRYPEQSGAPVDMKIPPTRSFGSAGFVVALDQTVSTFYE
ncbi:hypothetical protein [Pseudomonas sp. DTU12.3]|nr:hypothetical protein [Pseudomonas sp. DTU12.3]